MLSALGLKNFKCFRESATINFSNLNLLTGINGKGKSTVLQPLLLMRQSIEHSRSTNRVILNGSCVTLGTFDDIKNVDISRSNDIEFTFDFRSDQNQLLLEYKLMRDNDDEMVAVINSLKASAQTGPGLIKASMDVKDDKRVVLGENKFAPLYWHDMVFDQLPPKLDDLSKRLKDVNFQQIHYVSADRYGPQDHFIKHTITDFPNVGSKGEYTGSLLWRKQNDIVRKELQLDSGQTSAVLDQVEAWLVEIFDRAKIEVKSTDANVVIVSLNADGSTRTFRPANVGFGYSYILPIILSALIAKPGDILIVENPEAHLHPRAQSFIAKFLAQATHGGIQVFIESHSDHILNGLRIAVADKIITSDDLNVLYFSMLDDVAVTEVKVSEDGSIMDWPSGFFDQTDKDFSRLFRIA